MAGEKKIEKGILFVLLVDYSPSPLCNLFELLVESHVCIVPRLKEFSGLF